MPSNPLDTVNASRACLLFEFSYGDPLTFHRWARWASDVVADGNTYASLPTIEFDGGEQHGGSEDVKTYVTMPANVQPAPKFDGQRWGPTTVRIYECDPADVAGTLRTKYAGTIAFSRKNADGRSGVMKFELAGRKSRLDVPLGIIASSSCQNVFGQRPCNINLTPLRQTGTITAIEGTVITVTGAAAGNSVGHFDHGEVTVNGYGIKIVRMLAANRFDLGRQPPREWLAATGTFTPGCDFTLETCQNRWNNVSQFTGFGLKAPLRHPQAETGDGTPQAE
jgi:uncharacterized phage protein (TIGR02218 family)